MQQPHIILCSQSPRRKELISELGFEVDFMDINADESFPSDLSADAVAEYISNKKCDAVDFTFVDDDAVVVTCDTVVVFADKILGKPKDEADAKRMLQLLSGNKHKVITGVCIATKNKRKSFSISTDVWFNEINETEIDYYIRNCNPLDKAGAYGIQEWIGYIAIAKIEGSYNNVMGLPTQELYKRITNCAMNEQNDCLQAFSSEAAQSLRSNNYDFTN
jgi:septum formation protein